MSLRSTIIMFHFSIFRSTLIGALSHGIAIPPEQCNPAQKKPDVYARINEEITDWIRDKTRDAKPKKSDCNDI